MYQNWYTTYESTRPKATAARFYRSDSGREPCGNGLKAWRHRIEGSSAKTSKMSSFRGRLACQWCARFGRELWEVRSSLPHGRIAPVIFCVDKVFMALLHDLLNITHITPRHT